MGSKAVIVVVKAGQAKEQAWRSHLSKNPADRNADIKIFHFAPQKGLPGLKAKRAGKAKKPNGEINLS